MLINDLVAVLSSQEHDNFIKYLKARNKRHDTRNVDLFKKLIDQKQTGLKKELGQNAYAALKKRLSDNLLDFLSLSTVEKEATDEIGIIRLLLVARKLVAHEKFKSAFHLLKKAELKAEQINHYSLLNEIYQTIIENSYLMDNESHSELMVKFEANRDELVEQGKLNAAYAVVKRAYLKVERAGEQINLNELLTETYQRFNISEERGYNFKSLFQIAQLADFSGASSRNYFSVDTFFEEKIDDLVGGKLDTEKHLVYHIDLLYLLANIYFRKQQFEKSLTYLNSMHEQMQRFDSRFYQEKAVQFVTLKSLNDNYLGKPDFALTQLEDVMAADHPQEKLLNPLLCKMMILFQQNQLKEAKSILKQFSRTDQWYEKHQGQEWLLYKNFAEILLHIDLNNLDYVDSRLSGMKRKLKSAKTFENHPRIRVFIKWIDKYIQDPSIVKSDNFKAEVENSIEWKPKEEEDIFMMTFYAWLKSKMLGKGVYEVTLELLVV